MKGKSSNTTDTSDREIATTRIFDAPRELVFEMWTDPNHIGAWWGPLGFTTTTHTMDVKPGGVWRFVMHGPDGTDYKNKIVYLDVVKPERLVYKHAGEEDTEDIKFHVTVTFTAQGNQTKLSMRSLFDTAEERNTVVEKYGAIEGMHQTLRRLEELLASKVQSLSDKSFTLRVSRRFDATAEQVFDAWLDPNNAGRWLFATPTGKMVRVEIDPRVGGRFVIIERRDGVDAYHGGIYQEIDRPRRLVFSFGVDEQLTDAGSVQVDIIPVKDGCELTLTHEMSSKFAEYLERTVQGWTDIFRSLAGILK